MIMRISDYIKHKPTKCSNPFDFEFVPLIIQVTMLIRATADGYDL